MKMSVVCIRTESHFVNMASATWNSFPGNSRKPMVMSFFTGLGDKCAANHFVNVLFPANGVNNSFLVVVT